MKPVMGYSLLLVMGLALTASHAAAAPPAKTFLRQLLQTPAPNSKVCNDSQPFNFYVAPGFGCFLDAAPCSSQWFASSASRVNAIQNQATKSITNIRCSWPASTVAQLPQASLDALATTTTWGCYYFSLGGSINEQVWADGGGALTGVSMFQGSGKVLITGTRDLSITCKINPGTDKKIATARDMFSVYIGCLHGESVVDTPTGPRHVRQLSVGDKVLAQNPATGALVFDDVVLTPHKNEDSLTLYQDIRVSVPSAHESRRLQVTMSHYVPIGEGGKTFKLAKDVKVGDIISVVVDNTTSTAVVESSSVAPLKGFYGIWTSTGRIVVDGVLATAHAEWPTVDKLLNNLPGNTVQQHHMLQGPVRMLYAAAGPGPAKALSNIINALDTTPQAVISATAAAYTLASTKSGTTIKGGVST